VINNQTLPTSDELHSCILRPKRFVEVKGEVWVMLKLTAVGIEWDMVMLENMNGVFRSILELSVSGPSDGQLATTSRLNGYAGNNSCSLVLTS